MKVTLQDSALLVVNGTAGEQSRPALHCVAIREGKALAADGFMIVEHPVEVEGMDGQTILVPAQALKAAKPKSVAIKSFGRSRRVQSTKTRKVTVEPRETDMLVSGENTILCPRSTYSFPDFDSIKKGMIKSGEVSGYGRFQVSVLKKLLSVCTPSSYILFRFRDPKAGVEFISEETHGIVMPCFLDEKNYKWWALPPEVKEPEGPPLPSAEDQAVMYEKLAQGRSANATD